VAPDFELTEANLPHVIQICNLVEGIPLGILLAAAWVEMLSPVEIATEIASQASGGGIDFLEADWRGIPAQDALWGERHRSMRAVFDHSWNLLGEREREVFAGLSVFRGGCTRQAAQQVTGASLRELMALVDKSLLQRRRVFPTMREASGRYEVHELLRQYGAEKLGKFADKGQAVCDRHCAYYTSALQEWTTDLYGPRQQTAVPEMEMDIENARAAWGWAAEHRQIARLARAMEALDYFYRLRCRNHEGETAMSEAARELQATTPDSGLSPTVPSADRVLVRILVWQSYFCRELGQKELARRLLWAEWHTTPAMPKPSDCSHRA
jgi:predicted ATPase